MIDLVGVSRFVSHVWFVDGGHRNWLAVLYQDQDHPRFLVGFRFRYTFPAPCLYDSEANFYTSKFQTEEHGIKAVVDLAEGVAEEFGSCVQTLIVRSSDPRHICTKLRRIPWGQHLNHAVS
jgi:hypothetical protein